MAIKNTAMPKAPMVSPLCEFSKVNQKYAQIDAIKHGEPPQGRSKDGRKNKIDDVPGQTEMQKKACKTGEHNGYFQHARTLLDGLVPLNAENNGYGRNKGKPCTGQ